MRKSWKAYGGDPLGLPAFLCSGTGGDSNEITPCLRIF